MASHVYAAMVGSQLDNIRWAIDQLSCYTLCSLLWYEYGGEGRRLLLCVRIAWSLLLQAPSWLFFSCALSLFIYQSLDAIDGKQARRTKTNNQLGELFDHGCDAVSNILLIPCCGGAAALNERPNLFLALIAIQLSLFYCYHWLSYVIGELRFNWWAVTMLYQVLVCSRITLKWRVPLKLPLLKKHSTNILREEKANKAFKITK